MCKMKSPSLHLCLQCLNTFINGIYWCTFAPISTATSSAFDVNDVGVNMLSLLYMILYPVGSWIASEILERKGLRANMLTGSGLDLLGGVLRVIAIVSLKYLSLSRHVAFAILLIGQGLGALAQPLFTNTVVKYTTTWFKHHDGPTVLASLMSPLGNAAGQILPVLLVDSSGGGMDYLMYIQLALSVVVFLPVLLMFEDAPDHPVSTITGGREKTLQVLVNSQTEKTWQHVKLMMTDLEFLKLFVGVGIGVGLFNGIITLTAQLLEPVGYTDDDAGTAGALFIGAGIIAAGIVGVIMDKTKAYTTLFRIGGCVAAVVIICFCFVLRPGSSSLVFSGFGALGAATIPLLPVVFECSAACTYPLPEDISNGLLMLAGQIFGIIDTFLLPPLITLSGDSYKYGTTYFTPVTWYLAGHGVLIIIFCLWFKGEDKRGKVVSPPGEVMMTPIPGEV